MKLFLGLFLVSSLLSSCDKDDNDNGDTSKNYLKVGDTEYVLFKGAMENYGTNDNEDEEWNYDGYNIDLSLASEGISITTNSYGEMNYSGSGQLLYFEMFSSKGNEFDSREYTFSSANNFPIGTFNDGEYSLAYTDDDDEWIEITSGEITISKSGSEYSITIACTDENDKSVTGFFKGSLQYFDNTTETKSASLKSAAKIAKREKQ